MTSDPFTALAGRLRVSPGAPVPHSLSSTRQDWAARLGEGRLVETLPGLMASVFNLCSQAHRLCSSLAIEAAAPGLLAAPQQVAERLRLETAQEHVRRIGLDWPRLLGVTGDQDQDVMASAVVLRGCPLLAPNTGKRWADTARWLHQTWLGMPASDWLTAWAVDGVDWLRTWSAQHGSGVHGLGLATLLRDARGADSGEVLDPGAALRVHAAPEQMRLLGSTLVSTPLFALQPQWGGGCAHTGSWARLNAPEEATPLTPWAQLGCRLAELVRLCLPGEGQGAGWLAWGALATGSNQGLAWVEMARGLLVHHVVLDGACARVVACRVLAPTEWNFHPIGVVAQRVSRLDGYTPDALRQLRLLMAAFDPCVPFECGAQLDARRETVHA
ncbi:hypothetical protein AE621_03905 [Acidovorax sp. SD340]|nr:hypothetical protein AE621_03905 [Acidovorax sp. SD340]